MTIYVDDDRYALTSEIVREIGTYSEYALRF